MRERGNVGVCECCVQMRRTKKSTFCRVDQSCGDRLMSVV
jgi:hypothetical protein